MIWSVGSDNDPRSTLASALNPAILTILTVVMEKKEKVAKKKKTVEIK